MLEHIHFLNQYETMWNRLHFKVKDIEGPLNIVLFAMKLSFSYIYCTNSYKACTHALLNKLAKFETVTAHFRNLPFSLPSDAYMYFLYDPLFVAPLASSQSNHLFHSAR